MDRTLATRYAESVRQLERAEAVIPLGSQTFSKSRTQYPVGAAPLFVERSEGCHTWDVDGNEYIDLVSSLGAVIFGYCEFVMITPAEPEQVQQQREGLIAALKSLLG